jgi:DNA repair protein RecO (recombination protein O)
MAIIQDAAIALGRLDYSETSQIIVFFTREHGKVRAIAKGIKRGTKKRFATGIDLLDAAQLAVAAPKEAASGLATLTEWKQARTFLGLREKLVRIHAAEYAAEITARLTEDWDAHPGVYESLVECLEALATAAGFLDPVFIYQRSLLKAVGSWPVFHSCVQCGTAGELPYFSSFEGGLLCESCTAAQAEKRRVRLQTVEVLRGQAGAEVTEGAFALLNYHIAHLMGREPLLARHLLSSKRTVTRDS